MYNTQSSSLLHLLRYSSDNDSLHASIGIFPTSNAIGGLRAASSEDDASQRQPFKAIYWGTFWLLPNDANLFPLLSLPGGTMGTAVRRSYTVRSTWAGRSRAVRLCLPVLASLSTKRSNESIESTFEGGRFTLSNRPSFQANRRLVSGAREMSIYSCLDRLSRRTRCQRKEIICPISNTQKCKLVSL